MSYQRWIRAYRDDPAAVTEGEPGHTPPFCVDEADGVRLTYRVRGSAEQATIEALGRLMPEGGTVLTEGPIDWHQLRSSDGHWCGQRVVLLTGAWSARGD